MSKAPPRLRSLARSHTESALNVLSGIMNKETASDNARVSAASAILDRGWGKPTQLIAGDDDADPLRIIQTIARKIIDPNGDSGNSNGSGVPPAP